MKLNKGLLQVGLVVGIASVFAAILLLTKLNNYAKVSFSDALCGGQPESCLTAKARFSCGNWVPVQESKGSCCSHGSYCAAGQTVDCSKGDYCIASLHEEKCNDVTSVNFGKHCFNSVNIDCSQKSRCQVNPNPSPTPSPTASPTSSPTGTPVSTPTSTPTSTPENTPTPSSTPVPSGTPNFCGGTCGSNYNCQGGLFCYQGFCRNPDCPGEASCGCRISTPPPVLGASTPPELPKTGVDDLGVLGGLLGIGVGGLFIFKKFRLI